MLEGEDESPGYQPEDDGEVKQSPRTSPRKTRRSVGRPRGTERSPESEFIMPSMSVGSLETSLAEARNSRMGNKSPEKAESRRRNTRHNTINGRPEQWQRPKATNEAAPPRVVPSRSQAPQLLGNDQESLSVMFDSIISIFKWGFEIFFGALRVLKTPLTYLLAIWLLFGTGVFLKNMLTNSMYASLSPICRIPGASFLDLPFCPIHRIDTQHGPPPPVEFDQLMQVQSKFEEVLEESAGGVSLPLDMKRGEASIRDLRQLVRYSQLQSKYVQRSFNVKSFSGSSCLFGSSSGQRL